MTDMKLQDIKLPDMKMQDMKLQDTLGSALLVSDRNCRRDFPPPLVSDKVAS